MKLSLKWTLIVAAVLGIAAAGTPYFVTQTGIVLKHPITGAVTGGWNGTNGDLTASGTVSAAVVKAAAGTAALPSVAVGTTTNGIYGSAADEVAIATAGTKRVWVDSVGGLRTITDVYPGGSVKIPAGLHFEWSGTGMFVCGPYGDGNIAIGNTAFTGFGRLMFGPGDASHPSLKVSGTTLQARLGDDSGDAGLQSMGAPLYEGKLATIPLIDVNTAVKTTIYTVPTGKTLVVTKVVVRSASSSLTTAQFGFGFNAGADDVIASALHAELTGSTLYTKLEPKVGAIVGNAADVFGIKCTVNQGEAATVTVDLFGFFQ